MSSAPLVYRKLSQPLFNSKIKALVRQRRYTEALQRYSRSPSLAAPFTFPSLLKACASPSHLNYGKAIHSTILALGLHSDPFITSSLISMYVRCGSLDTALHVFDTLLNNQVLVPDATVWNSMLDGYFRYGFFHQGISHFRRMQSLGILPDAYSLCILLGISGRFLGYLEGKQIHAYIVRSMLFGDPFLETSLIEMYSTFSRPREAWCVFLKLEDKSNVVPWNVTIGTFCANGMWARSLEIYSLMKDENVKIVSESLTITLSSCCQCQSVDFGEQVHCDVIKMGFQTDPYVYTSLLTMYGKCKLVEDAKKIFNQVPDKEIELWNAMISAYVFNGCAYDAFEVYTKMRFNFITPDSFTMSNILISCSMIGIYNVGRSLHAELVKRPIENTITVKSSLVTMYCKCGSVDEATSVFSTIREMDIVSWGSMISGFLQNGKFKEALDLFRIMETDGLRPDSDIMSTVISACNGLENIELGCMVHGYAIKSGLDLDVYVATSLVGMYSKCGFPDMAGNVFYSMPHKNLVAWNSMMTCYSLNGHPDKSIELFPQIVQHGFCPDSISITSALAAVSSIAALLKGKIIHGYLIRQEILSDTEVENALIDMYIKSGLLRYARNIFQSMSKKNVVTWNSMIAGYGSHGECDRALSLFHEMKSFGITPDDVTFLCLISSCNHSGLVDEGQNLLQSMNVEYGIEPKMEHYVNMVDLLGRAGRLDDAYSFIKNMPIEADRSIWLSLLCACRTHHDIELGEVAADNLLKLEPSRGSNYVQLLNLYGEAELWDKAAKLRVIMKEKGLKKIPGCSWIEVKNRIDVFFSGDSSSKKTVKIYETLHSLKRNMEKKGDDCHYYGL
ncbi:hypothetical protein SLE2022_123430 [Rubroshorea leprosula]